MCGSIGVVGENIKERAWEQEEFEIKRHISKQSAVKSQTARCHIFLMPDEEHLGGFYPDGFPRYFLYWWMWMLNVCLSCIVYGYYLNGYCNIDKRNEWTNDLSIVEALCIISCSFTMNL